MGFSWTSDDCNPLVVLDWSSQWLQMQLVSYLVSYLSLGTFGSTVVLTCLYYIHFIALKDDMQ